jgi:hypothetical protein
VSDSGPISAIDSRLSDEAISAFVDGQGESAERARIEEKARTDPELLARITAYQTQKRAIRAAFDGTLQEPLPLHLLVRRHPSPAAHAWRAAAAVLLFVAGAGAGGLLVQHVATPPAVVVAMNGGASTPAAVDELRSRADARRATLSAQSEEDAAKTGQGENTMSETAPTSTTGTVQSRAGEPAAPFGAAGGFMEQALAAYAAAGSPTASSSGAASSDDKAARRDLGAVLDVSGQAGATVALSGLGFHPLAQSPVMGGAGAGPSLVFADKDGRRVALVVANDPAALSGRGFQWLERDPLRVVAWSTNSGSFALVGPLNHDEMLALARAVVSQTFN